MSDDKDIYELKMFEDTVVLHDKNWTLNARRVPGGWIFSEWFGGGTRLMANVFVPYSNEAKLLANKE